MKCQAKALLISLLIHSAAIGSVIAVNSSFEQTRKTVFIDFTLLKPEAEEIPGTGNADTQATPAATTEKKQQTGPETPATAKTLKPSAPPHHSKAKKRVRTSKPHAKHERAAKLAENHENGGGGAGTESGEHQGSGFGPSIGPAKGTGSWVGTGTGTGIGSGSDSGSGSGNTQTASLGGSGGNAEQARERYIREQFLYIKRMIEKNLEYPAKARRMGWSGKVIVSFTILENGHVANEKIVTSSGHGVLDDNVISTIKKIEPFPRPPVRAELKIPITYRLEY